MQCDICSNHTTAAHGLLCPSCAREILYPLRILYATTIISRDSHARKVEALVKEAKDGVKANSHDDAKTLEYDIQIEETEEAKRRIDRIMQQNEILRDRIRIYKAQISEKKVEVASKRMQLQRCKEEFECGKNGAFDPIKADIKSISYRYDRQYKEIISARRYICRRAAHLAGLQKVNMETLGGRQEDAYTIAGIPLDDLRDLNHSSPREASAALSSATKLVTNVCHYLGLRLPAEITLPHEDWPHPTISSIASSHTHPAEGDALHYPYLTPSSPTASRVPPTTLSSPSRPRPLFLDRKLIQLAREEPVLYGLFIEGIALFAWDIAWLCRTQGVAVASESWEDICAIGKNLWTLLMMPAPSQSRTAVQRSTIATSSLRQDSSNKRLPTATPATQKLTPRTAAAATTPRLGLLSHSTSHNFLRSAIVPPALAPSTFSSTSTSTSPVNQFAASHSSSSSPTAWRFATPIRFIDKLKGTLQLDMAGLEWEMLEDESGGGEDVQDDRLGNRQAVEQTLEQTVKQTIERTTPTSLASVADKPQPMTNAGQGLLAKAQTRSASSGASGWMKLKSRTGLDFWDG